MVKPSYEQLVEALVQRDEVIAELRAGLAAAREEIAVLKRRLDQDSSTSSRPPSADNPYRKGLAKTSPVRRSGRKPGKQPGTGGTTLRLVDYPDETIEAAPVACGCGRDLAGVAGRVERRQVVERAEPPAPVVTEYRVHHVPCPGCGATVAGDVPAHVAGRVQYGPSTLAAAAEIGCAQYVPVARGAGLLNMLTGLNVSTGLMASVRSKAARLVEELFLPSAFGLIKTAAVVHVDETPARAAGKLAYVHVKTTETVAVLHVGDRSAATIDAHDLLTQFTGVIVRDGYKGYEHLTDAVHAWCGAHLLRDLEAIHRADPDGQIWARAMADVLLEALRLTTTAREAGRTELDPGDRERIERLYTGAFSHGLSLNAARDTTLAADAHRLATRFKEHREMILRFARDLAVPFTNNAAERDLRPVKIQQRTSGGTWRTLAGLADFALVRSYLTTATKNGITTLDALTALFQQRPYLPALAE